MRAMGHLPIEYISHESEGIAPRSARRRIDNMA
jgi:hypothetical protein